MKKVLYVLIGLVVLVCIAGLVIPKDFVIERDVTINKPVDQVFPYLKSLKNQNEWSVWAKMDPNMKTEYRGTDGTVGFVSGWEGNDDVGKGEQEIKSIAEGQRIDIELRFMKPWEATNQVTFTTEAAGDSQTRVKWAMAGRTPFPMNIMMVFMRSSVEKDFATGLANLKSNLEK